MSRDVQYVTYQNKNVSNDKSVHSITSNDIFMNAPAYCQLYSES